MTKRIITVVREDGEVDYIYENTAKYAPPPYKVKAVDREIYCSTTKESRAERQEGEINHL